MDHVNVDCSTGKVTVKTATPAEEAAFEAQRTADMALVQQVQAKVAADHLVIAAKAKNDPAFAALARLLGIPLQ